MLQFRSLGTRSWFDPRWASVFSRALESALRERVKDERWVHVTLTYDRAPWNSPEELYAAQSEDKHVAKFMQRLQAELGVNLRGKWLRKSEFQSGGWIHYHLVILLPKIEHATLKRCWGHGHVWVSRGNGRRVGYVCKYVAKGDGQLPRFLLKERARSVKLVSVSPGFWRSRDGSPLAIDLDAPLTPEEELGDVPPFDHDVAMDQLNAEWGVTQRVCNPPRGPRLSSVAYATLGDTLEASSQFYRIRDPHSLEDRVYHVPDIGRLLLMLASLRCCVLAGGLCGVDVDCDFIDVDCAVGRVGGRRVRSTRRPSLDRGLQDRSDVVRWSGLLGSAAWVDEYAFEWKVAA